ncbi:MAG TPA: CotH kinase family protein, partial [Microlunatus sp.]|nr:CotH kinase family protein [Microlunatus sp.]
MRVRNRRLIAAAVGVIALAAPFAVSSAAYAATPTIAITPTYADPAQGPVASEELKVKADFAGSPTLSLWSDVTGSNAKVTGLTGKKSNSSGIYTFSFRPLKDQHIWVQNDANSADRTPQKTITLAATSATLEAIKGNSTGTSATATATFTPARSGQSAELQALTLPTSMTNEMPAAVWKTIATAKQGSNGKATFTISNPLEIEHTYRAITKPSGGSVATVSNTVTFAAAKASKNTGLPTVYLNSNEGASINTRTRYFEGQFEMTAGAGCTAVAPRLAASKGRGNYSWTFAKKSFTVKLDKKADLCGMGSSKKWALVANAYDKSLMRNSIAGYVGSKMTNMAWTPKSKPVDLYINGSYRGSYILIERIAVAANRVNVP